MADQNKIEIRGRKETFDPKTVICSGHIYDKAGIMLRLDDKDNLAFWMELYLPKEKIIEWAAVLKTQTEGD